MRPTNPLIINTMAEITAEKKLEQIQEILNKGKKQKAPEMVSLREIKEKLNWTLELNSKGEIVKAYFGEKPQRKPKQEKQPKK